MRGPTTWGSLILELVLTPVTNIAHDMRATCFADKGVGLFGPRMSQLLIKNYVVIPIRARIGGQCCYGVIFFSKFVARGTAWLVLEKKKKVRGFSAREQGLFAGVETQHRFSKCYLDFCNRRSRRWIWLSTCWNLASRASNESCRRTLRWGSGWSWRAMVTNSLLSCARRRLNACNIASCCLVPLARSFKVTMAISLSKEPKWEAGKKGVSVLQLKAAKFFEQPQIFKKYFVRTVRQTR